MLGAPVTPAIDAEHTTDPPRPAETIAAAAVERADDVDVDDVSGLVEGVPVDAFQRSLDPGVVEQSGR
jgi:hypothetical protein